MRFKGTLFLAVLGVALLAFLLFVDKPAPKEESAAKILFKVEEGKITRVILEEGPTVISAVRGDRKWTLEKPVATLGNKEEWNSIALTLSTLDYDRVVDEKGHRLADYGLDRPALTVTFTEEKGRVHKVQFGLDNPTGSYAYARVANDPKVYLVSRYNRDKFKADLARLRESRAFGVDTLNLEGFDLQRPEGTLKAVKKHYNWFLEAPVPCRLSDTETDDLIRKLTEAKVADFLDGRKTEELKAAFGAVRYRLSLLAEKGARHVLEIGADSRFNREAAEVMAYNVDRDSYFTLPASLLDALNTPLEKLRSPDVVEFYPFEVKGITGYSGTTRQILTKGADDTWQWKQDKGAATLDAPKVEAFLSALRDLKATGFIDRPAAASAYGLDAPALKLILDVENKPGATVLLGKKEGDVVYVRNAEFATVFKVPAAVAEKLRFQPDSWRPAKPAGK